MDSIGVEDISLYNLFYNQFVVPSFTALGPLKLSLRSSQGRYLSVCSEAPILSPIKKRDDAQLWILESVDEHSQRTVRLRNAATSKYLGVTNHNSIHTPATPGITESWIVDIISMEGVYGKSGSPINFQVYLCNQNGDYLVCKDDQLRISAEAEPWCFEKRKISLAIVGAGNRGQIYATYAEEFPDLCEVVAVAEPRSFTRKMMAIKYNIPESQVFRDWKEMASEARMADAVCIATQDRMHAEPAVAFANRGYHILLEKPMSVDEAECIAIAHAAKQNNIVFAVGHVLRYTPYSRKLKELVDSGVIGNVINMQHLEPIGYWHFAHSYVRGNWSKTKHASFALMAKSCHDIDWMLWIMPNRCTKVSSFGSLSHFTKENKPQGGGTKCVECPIETSCAYSSKKIYLDKVREGFTGYPVNVLAEEPNIENITEAITNGPYGRCVYECDNDVVDNQVLSMLFEGGMTATFSMIAFTKEVCVRKTKIFGTRGELEGDSTSIKVFDFLTQKTTNYSPEDDQLVTKLNGHGNADYYLMRSFVDAVACQDPKKVLSDADETLRSHMVVLTAEHSRNSSQINDIAW